MALVRKNSDCDNNLSHHADYENDHVQNNLRFYNNIVTTNHDMIAFKSTSAFIITKDYICIY